MKVSAQFRVYAGVCGLLAVQNSSYTLVRRFGQGVLKESASSQSILAVGEMLKGVFCLFMVMRDLHIRTSKEEDVEQSSGSSAGGSSSEKREESPTPCRR